MDDVDAKEYLGKHNQDFQQLLDEHQRYEKDLEEFTVRPYLTASEQVHETELKKRKLALKDQMQAMINAFRTEEVAS